MKKLPVFKAFGETYGLVFGNLPTIAAITWLPLAIFYAAIYWILLKILPIIPALVGQLVLFSQSKSTDPREAIAAMMPILAPITQWQWAFNIGMFVIVSILGSGIPALRRARRTPWAFRSISASTSTRSTSC